MGVYRYGTSSGVHDLIVFVYGAFDLSETRNTEIEAKLKKFGELFLKETLNDDDEKELQALREYVTKEVPGLAEREEDRILAQELQQGLLREKAGQYDRKEDE